MGKQDPGWKILRFLFKGRKQRGAETVNYPFLTVAVIVTWLIYCQQSGNLFSIFDRHTVLRVIEISPAAPVASCRASNSCFQVCFRLTTLYPRFDLPQNYWRRGDWYRQGHGYQALSTVSNGGVKVTCLDWAERKTKRMKEIKQRDTWRDI